MEVYIASLRVRNKATADAVKPTSSADRCPCTSPLFVASVSVLGDFFFLGEVGTRWKRSDVEWGSEFDAVQSSHKT